LTKIVSDFRANLYERINRRVLGLWYPLNASLPSTAAAEFSEAPPLPLKAVSRLYEKGLQIDQAKCQRKRVRLSVPVISIGNLSVGGTGKTPLTIWMCRFFLGMGLCPAVLTRGYGRKGSSCGLVPPLDDPAGSAGLFGDEPAMISGYLPSVQVWVGRDRAASGNAALAHGGVDLLLLDDGFQHLALDRDLDIVLLDCRNPFGNGFVLPAGPLREPISNLGRADAFVITHAGKHADAGPLKDVLRRLFPGLPVFACRHKIKGITLIRGEPAFPIDALSDRKALVFAGIAGPEGFFRELREAGVRICETLSFPDHHGYTAGDFSKIFRSASGHGAEIIITTSKDAVRIPRPYRDAFATAELDLDFGPDLQGIFRFITARLAIPECQSPPNGAID
jgi:tetraacyldisaccharide 4'-kinase